MIKKLFKSLFSRIVMVILLILVQLGLLTLFVLRLTNYFVYFYLFLMLLSMLVVVHIINKDLNPAFKLAWAVMILLFPVGGGLFYLLFGTNSSRSRYIHGMDRVHTKSEPYRRQDPACSKCLRQLDVAAFTQSQYLTLCSGYPCYQHTTAEYLASGEIKFERLKVELKKAKKFIFLEYFIIKEGQMWTELLDILVEKAREGVEVRLIYDDVGCLTSLPYKYDQYLEGLGIRCCAFNPFKPVLSIRLNNRDHRKIVVIDGVIGFTGGINLADEYINLIHPHGHWKDTAVMLRGEAVGSLTVMFLETWSFARHEPVKYADYLPEACSSEVFLSDGFVQPYGDSPMDEERVGENCYLNILGHANDYVYIMTPYLIVGDEMMNQLELAAKSGVDVRIITPHIPDKKYVYLMTQSSYEPLIQAGVKIYEYTPGFVHAKMCVSDDTVATVGTVNLDYRSFYHHFECGVWFYRSGVVQSVREDFLKTLEVCQRITLEDCRKLPFRSRLIRSVLRLFAPLF